MTLLQILLSLSLVLSPAENLGPPSSDVPKGSPIEVEDGELVFADGPVIVEGVTHSTRHLFDDFYEICRKEDDRFFDDLDLVVKGSEYCSVIEIPPQKIEVRWDRCSCDSSSFCLSDQEVMRLNMVIGELNSQKGRR